MATPVYTYLTDSHAKGRKLLAVLVDPDKAPQHNLELLIEQPADIWLIGGSLITAGHLGRVATFLKNHSKRPVVIFPGHASHFTPEAHAVLFLSLISGRNADLLIGQHVIAAPQLKESGLEILPTGYILVEGGRLTTVNYMSQTLPIPADKLDIAASTALAGEMLGLKLIYIDAGSGAGNAISANMIQAVQQAITIPLMAGGGIRTPEAVQVACKAGADIVVVGNVLEKSPGLIKEMADAVK